MSTTSTDSTNASPRLYKIANEFWWVPARNSTVLAVRITHPMDYRTAIEDKLLALVEKESESERREAVSVMEPWVRTVEVNLKDPETMVADLMQTQVVHNLVASGNPERAEAASEEDAREAVEAQEEVNLMTFLAAASPSMD